MSKLTINIDAETHASLKRLAELDERSLTQYIGRVLRHHAGTLTSSTPVFKNNLDSTTDTKKRVTYLNDDYESKESIDNLWK
jgi:hypothetical protein